MSGAPLLRGLVEADPLVAGLLVAAIAAGAVAFVWTRLGGRRRGGS